MHDSALRRLLPLTAAAGARRASLLLALALLGDGCCLSVISGAVTGATGSHQETGGETSGQGTSGQGSGGQSSGGPSTGASATAGECAGMPPSLVVIPNTVDFGPTLINTEGMRSVTLVNCRPAPVTGITATPGGPDATLFTVQNTPVTLGSYGSATVNLGYAPLALETQSKGTVIFGGSDGEKATLNLFGEPTGTALTVTPNPCNFGYVPLNTTAVCCFTASNQSNVTISITGASNFANDDGAFALATTDNSIPPNPQTFPATPISIQGGASAEVCFSFTPTVTQEYSGQATLVTTDPTGTNPTLQLTGWGGGPQISCVPDSVNFGSVADHTTNAVPIICTNVGTAIPSTNLIIDPPTASPGVFTAGFDQNSDPYPLNGLAPGQSAQIDVAYTPTATSSDMGTLIIKNNGGIGTTLQIPLSGQGLNVGPCQFQVAPAQLDFGNQQIGVAMALAFDVTNVGNGICLIDGLRISNDASGAFAIVETSIKPDPVTRGIAIPPSSSLTVSTQFSPTSMGAFSAEILFPNQPVELTGTSEDTCLQVTPPSLAFGQLATDDAGIIVASQTQSFTISDPCQIGASIDAISIQNGPGDEGSQYSLPIGPPLPDFLSPGGQATYQLDCQPTSVGQHPAELLISDGTVDVLVPMTCSVQ